MHYPRILFLDVSCPKPYDAETLRTSPQGGTESTVTRIAEELASRNYEVIVAQHCRTQLGIGKAIYVGFDHLDQFASPPHATILLRTCVALPWLQKQPWWKGGGKLFGWLHDFNLNEWVQNYEIYAGSGIKLLGVSNTHKTSIVDAMIRQIGDTKGVTVDYVYNPIPDELVPDATPVRPRTFIFTASPHKGLENTLEQWRCIQRNLPMSTLYVLNPGYRQSSDARGPGVVSVGSRTHAETIGRVREACAVLHLNNVFPETFGIAHAEALAVGTPVLTGRLGANSEIIQDSRCLVDVTDPKMVVDRVLKWASGDRPEVRLDSKFRMSSVIGKWEELLA